MPKLGVRKTKIIPRKIGKSGGFKTPTRKLGARPFKTQYGSGNMRGEGAGNPSGSPILVYDINSPPEAYAQQQQITGALHDEYMAQLTPGLNDVIGGSVKLIEFISKPKNWLTILGIIVGIVILFLVLNSILQGEVKNTVSNLAKSQGFTRKKKK